MITGDYLPGRGDTRTAREYERRIRNLLRYESPVVRQMAARLIEEAKRDRRVSARQHRHLEGLLGPVVDNKWCQPEKRARCDIQPGTPDGLHGRLEE